MICSAIYHHGDKLVVDSPFDELLKDADVISHTLNDPTKDIKIKKRQDTKASVRNLGWNESI